MNRNEYPDTVLEVLEDRVTFNHKALKAVRRFAASRPWNGSLLARTAKFRQFNYELSIAYRMHKPELILERLDGTRSGNSYYIPSCHRIVLTGKLSVVTFLHEFAHARGMDERRACRWSINLFRKVFPRQYARLQSQGHMLISPARAAGEAQRREIL